MQLVRFQGMRLAWLGLAWPDRVPALLVCAVSVLFCFRVPEVYLSQNSHL